MEGTALQKIALGGGCHWCTEGVFRSLKGVSKVDQGWIASDGADAEFSEGIVVHYDPKRIALQDLVAIHLWTHSSTNNHSRRDKYRSAVYFFEPLEAIIIQEAIEQFQIENEVHIITKVLVFKDFKLNIEEQLDYFYKNPALPFCKNYITPKLKLLLEKYGQLMRVESKELVTK